jgi:hypothetical protein
LPMGMDAAAQKPSAHWERAGLPPPRGWAAQVLQAMATLEAPAPEGVSKAEGRAWLSRWVVSPRICLVHSPEGKPSRALRDLLERSGWRVVRDTPNSRPGEPGVRALAAGAALWIGLEAGEKIRQAPGPVAPGFSPPFFGAVQAVRLKVVRANDGTAILDDSWKAQGEGVSPQAAERAMLANLVEALKVKVKALRAKVPPEAAVVSFRIQKAEPDSPIVLDWLASTPGGAKRVPHEPSQPGTLSVSLPEGPGALLVAAATAGSLRVESLEPLVLTEKVRTGPTTPPQRLDGLATPR